MTQAQGLSPLAKGTRSVALRFGGLLVGLVTQSVLARTLSPYLYGQYGTISSNLQISGQLADLGAEQNTMRSLGIAERSPQLELRKLFTLRIATGLLGLCVAIVGVVMWPLPGELTAAILLAGLTLSVSALATSRSFLVMTGRPHLVQSALLVQAVVNLALILLVAARDSLTLTTAIGVFLIATAVGAIMCAHWTAWNGWGQAPNLKGAGDLVREALPLGMATSATVIAVRIPTTIVLLILGTTTAGLFHAVYRWMDFAQILPQNAMPVLFPRLVRMETGSRGTREFYEASASHLASAGLWLGAALWAAGEGAANLMYGSTYHSVASLAPLLGCALPATFVSYMQGNTLIAQGHYRMQFRIALATLLASLASYVLLTRQFGLLGAISASVVTEYATATVGAIVVWRTLSMPFPFRRVLNAGAFPLSIVIVALFLGSLLIVRFALAAFCVLMAVNALRAMLVLSEDDGKLINTSELEA